jgi:Ca2+/H+ antiporter
VHSGGRSSTGELLTCFCCIFIIIGVVTFTIYFSLQKKYKEEVVKNTVKASTMRRSPLTAGLSMTTEAEKHMDGEIDALFFNFMNMRYDTSYYCFFLKVCSVQWGAGL